MDPDIDVDTTDDDGGPTVEPKVWLSPWTHRKAITLRASQIEAPADGDLLDFPVLISIADPQIRSTALASGQDIVFTTGDARTILASEIESFTPTTSDQLVAWVKVPRLSATTDTTLYVYYGHPTPPPQTPADVWTADHLAVWHLNQVPTTGPGGGTIRDATRAARNGNAVQMESADSVPGRIGPGLRFNGTDEYLDFGPLNVGDAFTISMWIEFTGGNNVRTLMANSALGGDTNGFRFFVNTADFNSSDRRIYFETGNGGFNSMARVQTAPNAIALNTFAHVAVVANRAASTATIFVDGTSVATSAIRNNFRNNTDVDIARMMETNSLNFPGTLDQIEVATTLRSPEWIRTSVNNQSRPNNFHELGPQELAP
jgi:hypothetical protein